MRECSVGRLKISMEVIVDVMGEEGFRAILPHVERVLRGEAVEYESDVNFAGVGPRQLLVKYTPDRDRSGNVRGWIASILDLTDQKKAARMAADLEAMTILREMGSLYVRKGLELDECGALLYSEVINEKVAAGRALADSEARFRATFENAAVGVAHLGSNLMWLRANKALCRILGYSVAELVIKSLKDITHPDDIAADLAQIERMLCGTIDSYEMDKRYLRKDGTIIWGRLTVSCVRKSDGSIDYFVGVVEDITARKDAEELLRRQADLLDQSHDAIFTWKIGGA
jgi:PAS domain S-box-containing protein